MPGAREALTELHWYGVRIGVVSNCSFGQDVLRYELAKHGLADHLMFVMVSAEYCVRKPNVLLFERLRQNSALPAKISGLWEIDWRLTLLARRPRE
jgi:FMN phosphatase YigB (HAD superfamily)